VTTRALSAVLCAALAVTSLAATPQTVQLANAGESLIFAVIGDNGTGKKPQYEVGAQMAATHARFPFELVIMLGDNLYGRQKPKDYVDKFERPYAAILKSGVRFFAALGNHDDPNSRFYQGFNMGGERYYTFRQERRPLSRARHQPDEPGPAGVARARAA
jgi:hypothetical protein